MTPLREAECFEWCAVRGIGTCGPYQKPKFNTLAPSCFSIVPPEHGRSRASLSVALFNLDPDHPIKFNGALWWLHRWNIGSQDTEDIGISAMELVRRGSGNGSDVSTFPGLVFDRSEIMNLRICFVITAIFEWDASIIDSGGEYIVSSVKKRQGTDFDSGSGAVK